MGAAHKLQPSRVADGRTTLRSAAAPSSRSAFHTAPPAVRRTSSTDDRHRDRVHGFGLLMRRTSLARHRYAGSARRPVARPANHRPYLHVEWFTHFGGTTRSWGRLAGNLMRRTTT